MRIVHNLLQEYISRCFTVFFLLQIEQQLMYVYQTVMNPEYQDPNYEFSDISTDLSPVKKGPDGRVGPMQVTDLQYDEDSQSGSDD